MSPIPPNAGAVQLTSISDRQKSNIPSTFSSKNHSPVDGRYKPISVPFRAVSKSPTNGTSPGSPNPVKNRSWPLANTTSFMKSPSVSNAHKPLFACLNIPILSTPSPFQSPTNGKSLTPPNESDVVSTAPSPSVSTSQIPVLGV